MSIDFAYEEINCLKPVADSNFVQGIQDYVINTGTRVFIPSKSYFIMDVLLTGAGGSAATLPPQIQEDLAFSYDAANQAYSQAYFLAAGATVSSITNLAPQASALHHRMYRSNSWIKSVGGDVFQLEPDKYKRLLATSNTDVNGAASATFTRFPSVSGCPNSFEQIDLAADDTGTQPTLDITAGVNGALVGVNTNFTQDLIGASVYAAANPGDIYTFRGTVKTVTGALAATVDFGVVQAATPNYFFVKKAKSLGNISKNYTRMLFQPPLSIFDYKGYLSHGEFRVQLSPNVNYKTAMVDCSRKLTVATTTGSVQGTFDVAIKNVRFYVATAKLTTSIPEGIKNLDLWEYLVQSKPIGNQTANFVFTVPSSSTVLHVFLQSSQAGLSTKYPCSYFKAANGSELNLQSVQITYASKTAPKTSWSSKYTVTPTAGSGSVNTLQQMFFQRQLELGKDTQEGGCETFNDFLRLGPVYSFAFERDFSDRSTEVQIQVTYDLPPNGPTLAPAFDTLANFFLVAQYRKTAEITSSNGAITQVRVLNT